MPVTALISLNSSLSRRETAQITAEFKSQWEKNTIRSPHAVISRLNSYVRCCLLCPVSKWLICSEEINCCVSVHIHSQRIVHQHVQWQIIAVKAAAIWHAWSMRETHRKWLPTLLALVMLKLYFDNHKLGQSIVFSPADNDIHIQSWLKSLTKSHKTCQKYINKWKWCLNKMKYF